MSVIKAKNPGVSVQRAAEIMGKSPQFVRLSMQRKEINIGTALKMSSKYTYYISPKLLSEFTGIPVDEI